MGLNKRPRLCRKRQVPPIQKHCPNFTPKFGIGRFGNHCPNFTHYLSQKRAQPRVYSLLFVFFKV